jgi:hypothetical protein
MSDRFAIIKVEPIGTKKSPAFWDGRDARGNDVGGLRVFDLPVYPESKDSDDFAFFMRANNISIRQAYKALGISAAECSGLMRRSHKPAEPEDWTRMREVLRAVPREAGGK